MSNDRTLIRLTAFRRLGLRAVRWLCEALVRLYFPRRYLNGASHEAHGAPALYVLNHPNGLIDPVLLGIVLGRDIRFLAKSTFFENPFGRVAMAAFDCLPVYRRGDPGVTGAGSRKNAETFARCRDALLAGQAIALFPEGTTHSDAGLLPLKSGAARIALSAAAGHESLDFAVVPVALHYDAKTVFRSTAHIVVAAPISLGEHVRRYAHEPRAAIAGLTDVMAERLIAAMEEAAARAAKRVSARSEEVSGAMRLALTIVLSPLALLGVVTSYVPYRLAAPLAAAMTKDPEVLSTVKLLAGSLLIAVTWAIEIGIAALLGGALAATLTATLLAPTAYAALRLSELRNRTSSQ